MAHVARFGSFGERARTREGVGFWPFDVDETAAGESGRVLQVIDFINTLHRQINCLDKDFHPIAGCTQPAGVTQDFITGWDGFYRIASNYLVVALAHPDSLETLDVRQRIEAFATQAIEWRRLYQSAGGSPVGPALQPEHPREPGAAPGWLKWAVGGAVVLGLGYVTWKAGLWEKLRSRSRLPQKGESA